MYSEWESDKHKSDSGKGPRKRSKSAGRKKPKKPSERPQRQAEGE